MRIRMLHDRTGGRYDGQAWPPRGGVFDVPDEEGAELVAREIAEAVEVKVKAPAKASKPATG